MAQISSLSEARSAGRYVISFKLRNAADGLICATIAPEARIHATGRFFALSGHRYAPLMVGQDQGGEHALPENAENRSNDSV